MLWCFWCGGTFLIKNRSVLKLKWTFGVVCSRFSGFRRVNWVSWFHMPTIVSAGILRQTAHSDFQTAELNIFKSTESISGSHRKVPATSRVRCFQWAVYEIWKGENRSLFCCVGTISKMSFSKLNRGRGGERRHLHHPSPRYRLPQIILLLHPRCLYLLIYLLFYLVTWFTRLRNSSSAVERRPNTSSWKS